jgi:hypothetical protein
MHSLFSLVAKLLATYETLSARGTTGVFSRRQHFTFLAVFVLFETSTDPGFLKLKACQLSSSLSRGDAGIVSSISQKARTSPLL